MAIVVFNVTAFKLRYPQFAAVDNDLLQFYFDESGLYLSNTNCSRVPETKRQLLLWMLTAHIATLNGLGTTNPGNVPPVGRVSSATEGSVSASFDFPTTPTSAWFNSTPYGAQFWQATSSMRGFRYVPHVLYIP